MFWLILAITTAQIEDLISNKWNYLCIIDWLLNAILLYHSDAVKLCSSFTSVTISFKKRSNKNWKCHNRVPDDNLQSVSEFFGSQMIGSKCQTSQTVLTLILRGKKKKRNDISWILFMWRLIAKLLHLNHTSIKSLNLKPYSDLKMR